MSSGHTNRGGRQGNGRRARHGPPRPQQQGGQQANSVNSANGANGNGQARITQSTSLIASSARIAPIQAPRAPSGAANAPRDQRQSNEPGAAVGEQSSGAVNNASGANPTGIGNGRSEPRADKRAPQLIPPAQSARLASAREPAAQNDSAPSQTPDPAPETQTAQPSQSGEQLSQKPFIVTGRPHTHPYAPPAPSARRPEGADFGERLPMRPEARGDVGALIDSLHALFAQDRTVASQGGTTRCGICYMHFALADLEYREAEGYYVCKACARTLGPAPLPMVRRQQRL